VKKIFKKIMIITFSIIVVLGIVGFAVIQNPKFGKTPTGKRLEAIKSSPHFKNGSFQNLSYTPVMTKEANYFDIIANFIFNKHKRNKPIGKIPSVKTNLLNLDSTKDILVWFGHSSYFMQIDGKTVLVDPVFSGSAGPFSFMIKAFDGTDIYDANDIPEIDYLFITHDHWDHLDYESIIQLKQKVKKLICPLGVGEHLEYWGYDRNIIEEKDWYEEVLLDGGFLVNTLPARHFSGRGLTRNQSLWTAFVLQTPSMKVYIGGDSGYDNHFAKAGEKFGPFDLAILENGQSNPYWKYIHTSPEEVLQVAKDLRAKSVLPVHSSKFALALHDWDEPLKKITELNRNNDFRIITPMIGELVDLKDSAQSFSQWWVGIR
jgi:L-ascorbate metabolism protein UlaG (beta-lactamase superfamily)